MEAYWLQIIFVASVVLIMNMMAGVGVCTLFKRNMSPAVCELTGAVLMGTYMELLLEPLVLMKAPFSVAAICILVGFVLFSVIGVISFFRNFKNIFRVKKKNEKGSLKMGILLYATVIGITVFVMYKYLVLQHVDEDDSRFVVNAADMIETNLMFLTNPGTGTIISTWLGELIKDVVSPYSVLPATIAYFSGMKAVTAFHSVMPMIILVIISCVYYELADRFFPKRRDYKSLFVIFLWIVNIFGYYSVYGQETFMMTRLWQGKSIVASIGIPAVIMLLFDIYNEPNNKYTYFLLAMLNTSMCFFSGMGIILMAIMIFCYGVVYFVSKKDLKLLLFLGLTCIPNVLCYIIHLAIKIKIIK